MTLRQQIFVEKFFELAGNATAAARAAGFSPKTAHLAPYWVRDPETLPVHMRRYARPAIYRAVEERRREIREKGIADSEEVLRYLAKVLRGESESSVIAVEGKGDGTSEARIVQKPPDERERLKSAEILTRVLGMTDTKVSLNGGLPVIITGEDQLAD